MPFGMLQIMYNTCMHHGLTLSLIVYHYLLIHSNMTSLYISGIIYIFSMVTGSGVIAEACASLCVTLCKEQNTAENRSFMTICTFWQLIFSWPHDQCKINLWRAWGHSFFWCSMDWLCAWSWLHCEKVDKQVEGKKI